MSMRKPKTINPDEVDPSVYYYDEVYDEMTNERDLGKQSTKDPGQKLPKESKYIEGIKETAEIRKAEKELRKYKKYTQDRAELVADRLDGEEVFITEAYQRKLETIKKIEEERMKTLEKEKLHAMNFTRKNLRPERPEKSLGEPTDADKSVPKHRDDSKELNDETEDCDRNQKATGNSKIQEKSRKPKTLEERRKYLREVLAKRTTGTRYKEAVMRFKLRSAAHSEIAR